MSAAGEGVYIIEPLVGVTHGSFPAKPLRDELKAAGYLWSPQHQQWHGPLASLPARYHEAARAAGIVLNAETPPMPKTQGGED